MSAGFTLRASDGHMFTVAGVLRIGRAPESEILLPDDLVSRQHAKVWIDKERLLIRDEGSSNGTQVNGRALPAGSVANLRPGDNFRVGSTTFTVLAGANAAAMVAATSTTPMLPLEPTPAAPPRTTIQPRPDSIESAPPSAAAPAPAPPAAAGPGPTGSNPVRRKFSVALGSCLMLAVVVLCGGLGLFGATAGRPALSTALARVGGAPTPQPGSSAATPGPGTAAPGPPAVTAGAISAQVVSTSPAATPLAPADYAATGHNLVADLATLNSAQLIFIHDAKPAQATPGLDEDLRTIAAYAFKVGLDGETLNWATAAQDGGSAAAGQMAGLYAGLARYGFAQAIDAQNLRASLAAGSIDLAAASAQVADYGARAWNPSVTDPTVKGNPFLPHLAASDTVPAPAPIPAASQATLTSDLGPAAGPVIWLAAAAGTVTRTVSLPAGAPLADPRDPALLAGLITPAGQADAAQAQQAAEAGLLRLGAALQPPTGRHATNTLAMRSTVLRGETVGWIVAPGGQDTLQTNIAVALLTSDTPATDAFLAFGNSVALASKSGPASAGGGGANIVDTLFGLDQNNQPTQQGTVPVEARAPLVSLTISNLTISSVNKRDKSANSTFEADVQYAFDVQWTTSLVAPRITLDCVSGNHFEITTASGTQHINARGALILYPGAEDAYCYASRDGNSFGSASVRFLVGDSAGATQRAVQVETDSAALDLTLTADAAGTSAAQAQAATQTAAVVGTQNGLETEQAARQTAEFAAKITEIAAGTQTAQAGGLLTLNGTFGLNQSDAGCHFSDAPFTSGTLALTVDFGAGTASGSLQGGGGGSRNLSCPAEESTGTMNWQQTYSATFSGTVDKSTGALNLTGKLTGNNNVSWVGCKHQGDDVDCPAGYAQGYSFPVTFTGAVDKASGSGKGTWDVSPIVLPTSGDWSAGK